MNFGYLSEFWTLITGATTDTVEWFASLGNAVAGALGMVLVSIAHPVIDLILCVKFLFVNLLDILFNLLILPKYLFSIVGSLITNVGVSGEASVVWPVGLAGFINSIPMLAQIFPMIGIGMVVLFFLFTYKHFSHG